MVFIALHRKPDIAPITLLVTVVKIRRQSCFEGRICALDAKKTCLNIEQQPSQSCEVDTNDNNPLKNSILELRTACSVNGLESGACLKSSHYSVSYYSGL